MSRLIRYAARRTGAPVWVEEPFRVFFPLGVGAAIFGLLLWPMFYAGWWPIHPAVQHPRILIFGFGAAFVFGFLGTAWPRFLEAEAMRSGELAGLVVLWLFGQLAYGRGAIAGGDLFAGASCLWMLLILGRRLAGKDREWPPPGFAVAFLAVVFAAAALFSWGFGWGEASPALEHWRRLVAYQAFLLLPLLGVGSYLFSRFFPTPGAPPKSVSGRRRAAAVWACAALIVVSFALEVHASVRWGNVVRLLAIAVWAFGAVPRVVFGKAPGTRPWALRLGLALVAASFACRALWPGQLLAFQHLLFLGGFTQTMLLVADRVILGHCAPPGTAKPRSLLWRWIVWLMLLTAATRASADLVPSTRVSHHVYAALLLIVVLLIWWIEHGRRLRSVPEKEGNAP
ncbi:MAG: NnrS family protein [Verrucomicrobiales bacterium]